jgi:hypothetical protein
MAITIQQPDVPALYSLLNVVPDDGLMIVRNMYSQLTKKIRTIHKNLCITLVYIHNKIISLLSRTHQCCVGLSTDTFYYLISIRNATGFRLQKLT